MTGDELLNVYEAAWSATLTEIRERRSAPPVPFEAHTAGLTAVLDAARHEVLELVTAAVEELPGSDATGYYSSESDSGYREAQRHMEAALNELRPTTERTTS